MFNPNDAFSAAFENQGGSFGRLTLNSTTNGNNNASSNNPNRSTSSLSAPFVGPPSGFNSNPSASADSFLPDLAKLRIPTLDLDTLNDPPPALSSPLPMPASSPTLVDPDFYPYPPTPGVTPGVLSVDSNPHSLSAFASPMWSTRTSSSGAGGLSAGAALPPRSPPPGISLPPRLPPGLSNGGPGTPGFLDSSGAGAGVSAGGAIQAPGFLLGRQFGPDSSSGRIGHGTDRIGNGAGGGGSVGRELSGLQQQQLREAAFDAAFGSGQLSSGNLGGVVMTDEELGSLSSQLGGRMVGVVGSPPPSSPPTGRGMRAQAIVLSKLFSNKGSGSTSCISSNNDNENNNSNSNSNETGDAGGDDSEF